VPLHWEVVLVDIEFRQAEPEHVDLAVPLIYSAGGHEFDYVFDADKSTSFDFLNYAFIEGSGTEGYKNHVTALVDNRVVGIGAFFRSEDFSRLDRATGWQIIKFYGPLRCWSVLRRGTHMKDIMPLPPKNALFIQNVGVAESFQGKGIGSKLLERQIQIAREAGRRVCVLDVAVTNPRAQALYERLGFRVVQENRWNRKNSSIPVPDQRRMELIL